MAAVKLKLLPEMPIDEMLDFSEQWISGEMYRHIFSAAPTDATKRLIAVLKEARETLDYCQAYYNYAGARLSAANVDALLKELDGSKVRLPEPEGDWPEPLI